MYVLPRRNIHLAGSSIVELVLLLLFFSTVLARFRTKTRPKCRSFRNAFDRRTGGTTASDAFSPNNYSANCLGLLTDRTAKMAGVCVCRPLRAFWLFKRPFTEFQPLFQRRNNESPTVRCRHLEESVSFERQVLSIGQIVELQKSWSIFWFHNRWISIGSTGNRQHESSWFIHNIVHIEILSSYRLSHNCRFLVV